MAKEIKKGSKEAKKIFEGYKKRLEEGEDLNFSWLIKHENILTEEQMYILGELEIEVSKKKLELIKRENQLLEDLSKNSYEPKTDEEIQQELFEELLEEIKDLPKEEQEERIKWHKYSVKSDKEFESVREAFAKARDEEDELISKMSYEDYCKYFDARFKYGRDSIKISKDGKVTILDQNLKEDKK
ncbi:MAG: hypothetical protein IKB42_02870 [Clostridia bacterium]|nr:hypothetical protein [Clostridia bacterium]